MSDELEFEEAQENKDGDFFETWVQDEDLKYAIEQRGWIPKDPTNP